MRALCISWDPRKRAVDHGTENSIFVCLLFVQGDCLLSAMVNHHELHHHLENILYFCFFLFFQGWILFLFWIRRMRCLSAQYQSYFFWHQAIHVDKLFMKVCVIKCGDFLYGVSWRPRYDLLQLRKHLPQSNLQSLTNNISNVEPRMRALGELQLKNKIP